MWWSDHVILHFIISCPTSNHLVNAVNGRHIYILTATRSNTNIFHFWPCYNINWIQKALIKNVTGSFKLVSNRTFSFRLLFFLCTSRVSSMGKNKSKYHTYNVQITLVIRAFCIINYLFLFLKLFNLSGSNVVHTFITRCSSPSPQIHRWSRPILTNCVTKRFVYTSNKLLFLTWIKWN